MAIKSITIKSIYEYYHYRHYIFSYAKYSCIDDGFPDTPSPFAGLSIYADYINDCINNLFEGDENKTNQFISEMKNDFEQKNGHFEWITNNEHACYFLWVVIQAENIKDTIPLQKIYQYLKLPRRSTNSEDRFNIIVKFLYGCNWEELTIYSSLYDYIEQKKQLWLSIISEPNPFKTLDENDNELCEWSYNYLKDAINKKVPPNVFYPTQDIINQPVLNNHEKCLIINAIYNIEYLSYPIKDIARLFNIDYKRAFAQRKQRKKEGKVTVNVIINKKAKEMLDELQSHYQLSQVKTIEMLISQEYGKMKKLRPNSETPCEQSD